MGAPRSADKRAGPTHAWPNLGFRFRGQAIERLAHCTLQHYSAQEIVTSANWQLHASLSVSSRILDQCTSALADQRCSPGAPGIHFIL
jgi:hypothetical protein